MLGHLKGGGGGCVCTFINSNILRLLLRNRGSVKRSQAFLRRRVMQINKGITSNLILNRKKPSSCYPHKVHNNNNLILNVMN